MRSAPRVVDLTMRSAAVVCLTLAACGHDWGAAGTHRSAPFAPGVSNTVRFDGHLVVDQFGYRPNDPKFAVIRDPREGYDSAARFSPGPTYQVRRASDGSAVFTASPVPWRDGAVDPS